MAQDQQDKVQVQPELQATGDNEGEAQELESSNSVAMPEETPGPEASTEVARKRTRKKGKQVNPDELNPRPSLWPLALAFGIALFFFGIISNPVVLGLGIIVAIAAAIGWSLERR